MQTLPPYARATETNDTDLLPFQVAPATHRRVGGDPGTKQRRHSGQVEIEGNFEYKILIDDDTLRVASIGDSAQVFVRRVISKCRIGAELFDVGLAMWTGLIGIDQATDPDQISGLKTFTADPISVTRPTIS